MVCCVVPVNVSPQAPSVTPKVGVVLWFKLDTHTASPLTAVILKDGVVMLAAETLPVVQLAGVIHGVLKI